MTLGIAVGVRGHHEPERGHAHRRKPHEDRDILQAQEIIERSPARTPLIERLAREVAMSPRTFARRFHQSTGNTPREYIQRVKVEAAKRALEAGERISSVAGVAGYSDAAAFRRLFARLTGLTPADYRARYGPGAPPVTIVASRRQRGKRTQ